MRRRHRSPTSPRLATLHLAALLALATALAVPGLAPAVPGPGLADDPAAASAGLAARLSRADDAEEGWTVQARFRSGHALSVRFAVTNRGPGEQTAFALGHLFFPDGRARTYHWGRRSDAWDATHGGLRLDIGGGRLDLRGPSRRIELESRKKGVDIAIDFDALPAVGAQGGPEPWVVATPPARASGRIWVEGLDAPVPVEGAVLLRRSWSDAPSPQVARRAFDLLAGDADEGAAFWAVEHPDGRLRGRISVVRDGAVALETPELEIRLAGTTGPEPASYPGITRLSLRGPGVRGTLRVAEELLRHDPLGVIPQPFRFFVARDNAPRRSFSHARLSLELAGAEPVTLDAPGLLATSWVNPLD